MTPDPLILSIDTSDVALGVDLSAGGVSLGSRVLDEPRIHASMLVPTVSEVLSGAGTVMGDLDAVAVAMGPGSYTGLRIGVSSAKGFSYALDIPLIGVSTLRAMAAGCNPQHDQTALVTCLSSRKDEIYVQVWELGKRPAPLTDASAISLDDAVEYLQSTGRTGFVAAGSGTDRLVAALRELDGLTVSIPSAGSVQPTVRGVAVLASQAFADGHFEDVSSFEPAYLKDFVAKKGASPFESARHRQA